MTNAHGLDRARQDGMLFGIPLGELGWFQTLLMSFASGFAAFFGGTFLGIIGLLGYLAITGKQVDFAWSYKRVGFPLGVLVLAVALAYLGTMWARRMIRKG